MVTRELCKYMSFHVSYGHRRANYIGIDYERRFPGHWASILISVFDVLYRVDPKIWQRINCDDYRVVHGVSDWYEIRSNTCGDVLYIVTNTGFYVSSPQSCVELQRYIKHKYNEEIQLMNVSYDVRKYLYNRLRIGR